MWTVSRMTCDRLASKPRIRGDRVHSAEIPDLVKGDAVVPARHGQIVVRIGATSVANAAIWSQISSHAPGLEAHLELVHAVGGVGQDLLGDVAGRAR